VTRVATCDYEGRGAPQEVEVAHRHFLIGACIEHRQEYPGLDIRDAHDRHQPVAVAAAADDVGHFSRFGVSLVGEEVIVKTVLVAAAGESGLDGIDDDDVPPKRTPRSRGARRGSKDSRQCVAPWS
jgi:hypothetical protein